MISELMPSCLRMSATYFAAAISFPGGLVVLMRIKPSSQVSASPSSFANRMMPVPVELGELSREAQGLAGIEQMMKLRGRETQRAQK